MMPVTSFIIRYQPTAPKRGMYYLNGEAVASDGSMVNYTIKTKHRQLNGPSTQAVQLACRMAKATGARVLLSKDKDWEPVRVTP